MVRSPRLRKPMKERRTRDCPRVAAMLAIAILVGCLLAGGPLKERAANVASPALRSVALAVTSPLAEASDYLRLEGARRWVAEVLRGDDREHAGEQGTATPITGESLPEIPASPSTTAASPASFSTTSSISTTPSVSVTSTTSTTDAKPRVTAAQPLRVLVAGDSLVLQVGNGVTRLAERMPLETKVVSKPISGLSRPDFYDWPAVLHQTLAAFKPDVTVLMFGNNDKQDVMVDGKRIERWTPEWWALYRARVDAVLALATGAGSRVVWVGMPVMRSSAFAETARRFNAVYAEACAAADASFVDTYRVLSDEEGRYTAYLPGPSGQPVLMRNSDGIHLTEAGGDLVASDIARALRQYWDFE